MEKSVDAFRTISEVADWLEVPTHVLRFWESKFSQVKPVKRAGGRRYYRPADMSLLAGIRVLLHDQGMTIRGVQKLLREKGVKHVSDMCDRALNADPAPALLREPPAEPPAAEARSTVVELPASAFSQVAAPTELQPKSAPHDGDDAPLPLFASERPAPQPVQTQPASTAHAAHPTSPAPAVKAVSLPGPSPENPAALRGLLRKITAAPETLAAISPAQARNACEHLESLRARLAGSDPA